MESGHISRKRLSSYLPDYGAIFLANPSTRKECFARLLFALPSSFSDFVLKVRRGMLLFLYDFVRSKLDGVFVAASDGAMDIVPHAYESTGKRFSAQVRFRVLWQCDPLPENDFGEAIRENFYSPRQFNLGLSRDQVHRLLFLFGETKLKIQRCHLSEERCESGETEDPLRHESVLNPGLCSPGSYDRDSTDIDEQIDDSIQYRVQILCPGNSKPDYCFPGPRSRHKLKDGMEYDKSSGSRISGAHSNSREKCISVFQRLANLPKVTGQESGSNSESLQGIMNTLDKKHKIWQNRCTKRTRLCHRGGASKDKNAISRLGDKMYAKSEQRERVSGNKIRCSEKADIFSHRSLKRKSSSNVKTCRTSKDGKGKDALAENQHKRRRLKEKCFSEVPAERKTFTKSVSVPGSCLSIINNGSFGAPCRSEGSHAVVLNEGPFPTSFICEDENMDAENSVDDALRYPIHLGTSYHQDPVEMLLAEYKEYLARSVLLEDPIVNSLAEVDENFNSKKCTLLAEGPPESQSVPCAGAILAGNG